MSQSCNCIARAIKATRPTQPDRFVGKSLQAIRTFTSARSATSPAPSSVRAQACSSQISNFSSHRCRNLPSKARSPTSRGFSGTAARCKLDTIEQVRARNKGGPFNLMAGTLFVVTGGALWAYFTYEKERMARKRVAEQTKGMGRPKVGGPFDLIDHDGRPFSDDDMRGKYALVYFGFTHCPDICPDELDKMALMVDNVKEKCGNVILPIMISCDPARDTPAVLKEYLKEFHPDIVGLTGTYDNIKQTCKAYRVYFSTPPSVKPGQDYLVDHSIYFYLMDPEGDFVEAIGRNFTADQAAKVITDHIQDWNGPLNKKDRWA